MRTVFCIDCERPIRLEFRPVEGAVVTCSSCGADLEVISLEPVELDWACLEPVERVENWVWWNDRGEAPKSFPAWDWESRRDL